MKVKRSKMAKQQMRLKVEEEKWVEEMLKCMDSLQAVNLDAARAEADEPSVLSLNEIPKGGSVVAVSEVVPAD